MAYGRSARSCLGWAAIAAAVALAGCGSDAGLQIDNNTQCDGGSAPQVRGVVRLPNGRLAARAGFGDRLAALVSAPADALTGTVSPAGKGLEVRLVELRPEDVASGRDPGAVAYTTTNGSGEFCVPLARDTTVDVCRYVVEVGSRGNATLTRAFVYSTDEPIDIDYRSEATVQMILAALPGAGLCDFSPGEIAAIHQAVSDAPGTVVGATIAEVNAVAASLAADDANVRRVVREAGGLPAPTPTNPPGAPTSTSTAPPTATAVVPSATATHSGPTATRTLRPTRTPNQPTATAVPSRTATLAPTRTVTSGGATATATRPATATVPAATATATRPLATATATISTPAAATATATARPPTATATPAPPTATFTATPPPAAALGERVFTIREDSQSAGLDPRSGFFSSGLAGRSVSDHFSPGPIVLVGDAPGANGVAQLRLKQDVYFKINIMIGGTTLCVRWLAQGSHGSIDCNGGTAYGVTLTEPAGESPPGTPMTGIGGDSGPGAANLFVRQAITEVGNSCPTGGGTCSVTGEPCTLASDCAATLEHSKPCDATTTFADSGLDVVYTTANFAGTKGNTHFTKNGEAFDCATWTMTDGPGMLVTSLLAVDSRAGGTSANGIRVADQ